MSGNGNHSHVLGVGSIGMASGAEKGDGMRESALHAVSDEGAVKRGRERKRESLDIHHTKDAAPPPPPVTDRGGLGMKFLRRASRG